MGPFCRLARAIVRLQLAVTAHVMQGSTEPSTPNSFGMGSEALEYPSLDTAISDVPQAQAELSIRASSSPGLMQRSAFNPTPGASQSPISAPPAASQSPVRFPSSVWDLMLEEKREKEIDREMHTRPAQRLLQEKRAMDREGTKDMHSITTQNLGRTALHSTRSSWDGSPAVGRKKPSRFDKR